MITVNEYFDGAVKSLGYQSNGQSTVGVIDPGTYEFGTDAHETMFIIEGEMQVLLPQGNAWETYYAGQKFEVAAKSSFKVKVDGQVSYHCKYRP